MQKIFYSVFNVLANSDHIYLSWLPETGVNFWVWESQKNHVLSYLTGAPLQDDAIANFQFQRLVSY